MSDFREYLNEQLKNPEFKKEWDALEPEFNMIQAMIDARKNMILRNSQRFRNARNSLRKMKEETKQCVIW